jgi:hypothetical protein
MDCSSKRLASAGSFNAMDATWTSQAFAPQKAFSNLSQAVMAPKTPDFPQMPARIIHAKIRMMHW